MADKDYHNKGQEDASEGKYDPPHSKPGGGWLNDYSDEEVEDQKDYKQGWRHTTDQKS